MKQHAQYSTRSQQDFAAFLDSVIARKEKGEDTAAILDSVKNDGAESGVKLPKALDELLGKMQGKHESRILDSIAIGVQRFKAEHGVYPTADVVEAAVQQGSSAFDCIGPDGRSMLDNVANSASSAHHDQGSLQPNRAVVATLTAIAEAIPFAGYLPVDIASNQSKLAILSHTAGSAFGDYAQGAIMDGVNVGGIYASSARYARVDVSVGGAGPWATKFTQTNLTSEAGMCDPAGTGVPVLRGRTRIYVNGKLAAKDIFSGSGATSPISGSVDIGGTTFTIAGTVTLATGAVSLTTFSGGTITDLDVVAESIIDYEAAPALIPLFQVRADTFDLYANPWRALTNISIDASSQLRNELNLDGNAEALMAMRTQMAMERHYIALGKVARLGKNLSKPYNFDWTGRNQDMNRSQIAQDLLAFLSTVDQEMANNTMDHGVTHYYVGSWLAGIFYELGRDFFEPSGITARPGVFRVGRLFGKYEIYYTPKFATQAANLQTAKMIGVGRSSQVARNPILLGDSVAPTFLDLNMQSDLKKQAAIYARDFTEVNPHEPSALGCCEINLTNLAA